MERNFTILIEQGEDGYLIASVPSIPGCHTQAKTMDELLENIKEAVLLCLDVQKDEVPEESFLGIQQIRVDV